MNAANWLHLHIQVRLWGRCSACECVVGAVIVDGDAVFLCVVVVSVVVVCMLRVCTCTHMRMYVCVDVCIHACVGVGKWVGN